MVFLIVQYNGCAWKGGRLRLEKAKEHYLARLRREWEEDAQLASKPPSDVGDADKIMTSSEKPKKDKNLETRQLRLFFPRLRKVRFKKLLYFGFDLLFRGGRRRRKTLSIIFVFLWRIASTSVVTQCLL